MTELVKFIAKLTQEFPDVQYLRFCCGGQHFAAYNSDGTYSSYGRSKQIAKLLQKCGFEDASPMDEYAQFGEDKLAKKTIGDESVNCPTELRGKAVEDESGKYIYFLRD